jgi:thiamine-monophosphate kinase
MSAGAEGEPASEQAIIELVGKRFTATDNRIVVGPGDDAAVIRSDGLPDSARRLNAADTAVTTDLLVEGVHFSLKYMNLADAGYKALMANLSDIAAMGGQPTFVFGMLGVPRGARLAEVQELLAGVSQAAEECGAQLTGGDTVAAPQWIIGFTVLGDIPGAAITRGGALPGDIIWHSGSLGLSQVGLHLLWSGQAGRDELEADTPDSAAVRAHIRPVAQVALGRFLRRGGLASGLLDLSDSLAQSLMHLATASGKGLSLDFSSYPYHAAVERFCDSQRRWKDGGPHGFQLPKKVNPGGEVLRFRTRAEFLLAASEDFQLLFTAPPAATPRLLSASPVPLAKIGTVQAAGEPNYYRAEDGRTYELAALGYAHL